MNLKKAVKSKRNWVILGLALSKIFNWSIPVELTETLRAFTL